MRMRTRKATYNLSIGTSPVEVLGPNPFRRAFALSPLVPAGLPAGLALAVFGAGAGQTWAVPAGVVAIQDAYLWGCGGTAGDQDGVSLGGGGGGGGAFVSTGLLAATPGTVWTVGVGAGGSATDTILTNPSSVQVADAGAGQNGVADAGGAGGTPALAPNRVFGGNGAAATSLAGVGGGGGGAAGSWTVGGAGAGQAAGAGGGTPTLGGYGFGGAGGAGGASAASGGDASAPGGGAGGAGLNGMTGGAAQAGRAVIFYQSPAVIYSVSLSPRADVAAGKGTFNWPSGLSWPTMVCDDEIGDIIGEPWYLVSGIAGVTVQITEFMYEPDETFRAF